MLKFMVYECDICGKKIDNYHFRYKFKRIYKDDFGPIDTTLHMCDWCYEQFKKYVKESEKQ